MARHGSIGIRGILVLDQVIWSEVASFLVRHTRIDGVTRCTSDPGTDTEVAEGETLFSLIDCLEQYGVHPTTAYQ
jgi:hypothetical protein